jgi:hypothetical protein
MQKIKKAIKRLATAILFTLLAPFIFIAIQWDNFISEEDKEEKQHGMDKDI